MREPIHTLRKTWEILICQLSCFVELLLPFKPSQNLAVMQTIPEFSRDAIYPSISEHPVSCHESSQR
jgi:hypothetical protein